MNLLHTLRPTMSSMGYALFLAINAAGVWGGSFPFLPNEFQTDIIVYAFFGAQSLTFGISYAASAVGVYFFPQPTRRFMVFTAGAPYFVGWACLIAAMYVVEAALPFMVAGGALLGLGSAGFYMLWQRLFASQSPEQGSRDLIVGTAYSAVMYFSLYLIPSSVTALLIPLVFLPLFGLTIVLKSRTIDANQPMFEDMPREHPQVYRRVLRDFLPSALSVGALGLCCGIVRSLAVSDPATGDIVNVVSMVGSLVSAVVLLALWQRKDLRINVVTVYRALFPFVITAFVLLAIFGVVSEGYLTVFAGTMYAFYSFGIMLMMLQCAQASRDRGINPVFIYGAFGGLVYILHDLGFMGGLGAESLAALGLSPTAGAAILGLWLLAIMYFVGQGGFAAALSPGRMQADSIEFVALNAIEADRQATGAGGWAGAAGAGDRAGAGDGVTDAGDRTGANGGANEPTGANLLDEMSFDLMGSAADACAAPAFGAETANASLDFLSSGAGMCNDAALVGADLRGTGAQGENSGRPGVSDQARGRSGEDVVYRDRISKQCAALRKHYHLSSREAEVMELMARGNTMPAIAEALVVSENTIRTHARRIYSKLAIHKRQELIDLVNFFIPENGGEGK